MPRITLSVNRDDFCESRGANIGSKPRQGRDQAKGGLRGFDCRPIPGSLATSTAAVGSQGWSPSEFLSSATTESLAIGAIGTIVTTGRSTILLPGISSGMGGGLADSNQEFARSKEGKTNAPRRRSPSPGWPGRDSDPSGSSGGLQGWRSDKRMAVGLGIEPSSRRSTVGSRRESCSRPRNRSTRRRRRAARRSSSPTPTGRSFSSRSPRGPSRGSPPQGAGSASW